VGMIYLVILEDTPRVAAEICGGVYKSYAMKNENPTYRTLVCQRLKEIFA
jgi:hypothetical protein